MISFKNQFLQFVAQTSPTPPSLEIVKARGIYLRTADGKRYIDLISGIGVSNLGHRPESVSNAIRKQLGKYLHTMVYGEYILQPQVQLAKKLAELLPENLNSTYLVNSGSEAIEGAMKLAKRITGRHKFVACKNAYHGSTQGALSLMSDPYYSDFYRPLLPEVYFMNYNDVQSTDAIDDEAAAVIIEIVQGEGGYIAGTDEFLIAVADKCKKNGALLIVDEIQTGIGRTGKLFAFQHTALVPDIICTAKAFGGGMPLGAFITSKEKMQFLADKPVLGHITTFGGHPLSAAAGLANLKLLLKSGLMNEVYDKELLFRKRLVHPEILEISGRGLMLAIRLQSEEKVKKAIAHLLENGVITDWFLHEPNKIRLAPPLIISKPEIIRVCKKICHALDTLKD
ncbi:MAG: aminotransferase class III-fold pyridoxal phosphate-dependent enzyme [Bacteroidetes bacterium]|nr:aminotransferase class III-fold pyridoxal phosphate-dependent enzyme [Bacteroidota bacterium]